MSSEDGFTLFDTPIGRCGIAWSPRGIAGVQLPEGREATTRARLRRRFPEAAEAPPPPPVRQAVAGIVALLGGAEVAGGAERVLREVALDLERVPLFHRRVYAEARRIPPGATVSYGELAARLGAQGGSRAVGQALGRNPFAIVVPCHRVVGANGRIGGFSANGGVETKLRLLELERSWVSVPEAPPPASAARLGFDPAEAVATLRAADATLGRLIDAVGPCRLRPNPPPTLFAALAEDIVYQQLHGKAAATIFGRVCALARGGRLDAAAMARLSDDALRGAGLSRAKLLALRDLAAHDRAGTLPSVEELGALDDEAVIERLTVVRGIGRWTVEMLLIFRLGRPDVLPLGDDGVRKGYGLTFRRGVMPTPAAVARRGARWAPFRSVASWYLWRALEPRP